MLCIKAKHDVFPRMGKTTDTGRESRKTWKNIDATHNIMWVDWRHSNNDDQCIIQQQQRIFEYGY